MTRLPVWIAVPVWTIGIVGAVWVTVAEPMGRRFAQPALVSDQAASRREAVAARAAGIAQTQSGNNNDDRPS